MRRAVAFLLGSALLTAGPGCRNCDLVEAELRARETDIYNMRTDLHHAEAMNEALLRELQAYRASPSGNHVPLEQASQVYGMRSIALGRQTGGYDDDGKPGDEALQVALEPRDADGHVIKSPGALHVDALEITTEGLKTPLSSWDIPADQLRRAWKSGLFSNGYFVVLPWKNWPNSEKVRVVARFSLPDGRAFEADKDVTVRLAPASLRRRAPEIVEPIGPMLTEPEKLPLPKKTDNMSRGNPAQKWWLAPAVTKPGSPVETTLTWRPKADPNLAEAVRFLKPEPILYQTSADLYRE